MITIHRNNSRLLQFTFKKSDGTAWNVPSGNVLKFSVKKSVVDTATVIEKTFNGNGGNAYSIFLSGSDTNINCGVYKYDIKDTTANLTYCNPTNFVISEVVNVGESVVGSQNEDDSVEIVVDTAIINTDYSILTNKPTINSVELSGNKTSADLSMYTKTEVDTAISSAISGVTSFNYTVVSELPASGVKGTIYLVPNGETENKHDEYLWISEGVATPYWEKMGPKDLDISGKLDKVTTTNKLYGTDSVGGQTTYNKSDFASASDIPTKTSDLTNDSGFLTSHQDISGKLDKVATATNLKQVYGKNEDGTQNMFDLNFTGSDGVAYKVGGRIKLNHNYSVCQYNDVVNKQDVETMISGKADVSDIPTKTSDLTNDSGFLTSHQDISGKVDKRNTPASGNYTLYGVDAQNNQAMFLINTTGATNINSIPYMMGGKISAQGVPTVGKDLTNKLYVDTAIATKQNALTAGMGIDITNNVISASENWELINTADFTGEGQEVNQVVFERDSNNQNFSLSNFRLIITLLEDAGNRTDIVINRDKTSSSRYYYNNSNFKLYNIGLDLIIEPLYNLYNMLDYEHSCPPPLVWYGQSRQIQILGQYYTYSIQRSLSKNAFYPIEDITISLISSVKGTIKLYGVRS